MYDQNISKAADWVKKSVTIKLITITLLMIMLLIPQSMIQSIIHDRENMSQTAISEVSSKWANPQNIMGPILTIPMTFKKENITDSDNELTEQRLLRILPSKLTINGSVEPKELTRGIYKVIVYQSDMKISGTMKYQIS